MALMLLVLTSCARIDSQPPFVPETQQDTTNESEAFLHLAPPSKDDSASEPPLSDPESLQDTVETETPECTYEWITGIAEVDAWENDRAILVFYPGEIRLSVDRTSITPFLSEQQHEIKSRLQKPLNNHCGKPAISFSSDQLP